MPNKRKGKDHPAFKTGSGIFQRLGREGKPRQCEICKSAKHLHVHHVDVNRKNNVKSNLVLLCASCHLKYHGLLTKERNVEPIIINASFIIDPIYKTLETKESVSIVDDCIMKLPKRNRDIFVQRMFTDDSLTEIGNKYNISRERVRQLFVVGKKRVIGWYKQKNLDKA